MLPVNQKWTRDSLTSGKGNLCHLHLSYLTEYKPSNTACSNLQKLFEALHARLKHQPVLFLLLSAVNAWRRLAPERKPAQEVRYEAFASGTLERVPQSVVQVAGD